MGDHGHHHHGDGCGHEGDDHLKAGEGLDDFLYSKIDLDHVVGFNDKPDRPSRACVKPWDRRADEESYAESDADEQLIIRIPFTGSVKLRTVFVKAGPGDMTPSELRLFANADNLDFDSASSTTPTQVLSIPQTRELAEYPVRPAKFSSVKSLTLFIPSNGGADVSRVYFLGFKGAFTPLSREPVVTVYEATPNPADHQKISGIGQGVGREL